MTPEQRKHLEYVRDEMHGDEQKEDKFCDNNCVWTDHHPDCVRAEPEWYHGVDAHGCNRFYHKTEDRTSEFNTPLYTTPPQRKPLTCFDTEKLAKQCGVEWTTRIDKLCKLAIEAAHGIK